MLLDRFHALFQIQYVEVSHLLPKLIAIQSRDKVTDVFVTTFR